MRRALVSAVSVLVLLSACGRAPSATTTLPDVDRSESAEPGRRQAPTHSRTVVEAAGHTAPSEARVEVGAAAEVRIGGGGGVGQLSMQGGAGGAGAAGAVHVEGESGTGQPPTETEPAPEE